MTTLLRPNSTKKFPLKLWNASSATASSQQSASFVPSKAMDGDLFISGTGKGWVTATGLTLNEWIQLNFNRNYNKTIVCLGDSQTAGANFHNPDPTLYGKADNPANCYESHLQRVLPDWTIINKGVGSNTTAMMVTRFTTDVINQNPSYVIILGGVNDIAGAVAIGTIEANLTSMYNSALTSGIVPVLCTLLPWNNGTSPQRDTLDQLNAWIRDYARTNQLPLVDFFKALEDPANLRTMPALLNNDGVHPSQAGYRVMAEAIDINIFQAYRNLKAILISTQIDATFINGLLMPTQVRIDIGNLSQVVTLGALVANKYEGIFLLDLADQNVTANSVKITVLAGIKHPDSTTTDFTGFGEIQLLF